MNGHFRPIEKFLRSLKAEDEIFATYYLIDLMKQYVPIQKIPSIFQRVRDGVKCYSINRRYPMIGHSEKDNRPKKRIIYQFDERGRLRKKNGGV